MHVIDESGMRTLARISYCRSHLVCEGHPTALQLRDLQTLLELGASQSTTIVFPAPIDMIKPFIENFSA